MFVFDCLDVAERLNSIKTSDRGTKCQLLNVIDLRLSKFEYQEFVGQFMGKFMGTIRGEIHGEILGAILGAILGMIRG